VKFCWLVTTLIIGGIFSCLNYGVPVIDLIFYVLLLLVIMKLFRATGELKCKSAQCTYRPVFNLMVKILQMIIHVRLFMYTYQVTIVDKETYGSRALRDGLILMGHVRCNRIEVNQFQLHGMIDVMKNGRSSLDLVVAIYECTLLVVISLKLYFLIVLGWTCLI
jgi:hypothetical protein